MINEINVVIGSWGSYNACNERALGSGWLDFSEYDEWEQIEENSSARFQIGWHRRRAVRTGHRRTPLGRHELGLRHPKNLLKC